MGYIYHHIKSETIEILSKFQSSQLPIESRFIFFGLKIPQPPPLLRLANGATVTFIYACFHIFCHPKIADKVFQSVSVSPKKRVWQWMHFNDNATNPLDMAKYCSRGCLFLFKKKKKENHTVSNLSNNQIVTEIRKNRKRRRSLAPWNNSLVCRNFSRCNLYSQCFFGLLKLGSSGLVGLSLKEVCKTNGENPEDVPHSDRTGQSHQVGCMPYI